MISTPSTPPANNGLLRAISNGVAWRVGVVLEAVALTDNQGGSVRLQVGNSVITAQTRLAMQPGQQLRLTVVESGRTVVLKASSSGIDTDPVANSIRQTLPRQQAQAPLLATATALTRNNAAPSSPQLQQVINQFSAAIRDASQLLTVDSLKAAVRESGTFLENNLLNASTRPSLQSHVATDWKAALLKLGQHLSQLQAAPAAKPAVQPSALTPTTANVAASLPSQVGPGLPGQKVLASSMQASAMANSTNAGAPGAQAARVVPVITEAAVPPPLRGSLPTPQAAIGSVGMALDPVSLVGVLAAQCEGALARVKLNQLASLPVDATAKQVWLLELPVRHKDDSVEVVPLRIEREKNRDAEQEQTLWSVNLAFDLGARGALHARLSLRDGRIHATFYAEKNRTQSAVDAGLGQLRERLQKKQIPVATLSCAANAPVTAEPELHTLVNTQA